VQHVEVSHRFPVPPSAVWEVYTDHAGWSAWSGLPGAKLVREGSVDRNGTGAIRSFAGSVREEVLDFEAPARMSYSVVGGLFPVRNHLGEVLFEADGPGTRIVWRCRFDPVVPGTGWLLRGIVKVTFQRALRGLERRGLAAPRP